MTVCFCGHGNLYGNHDEVKQKCLGAVLLQAAAGADRFLVGDYGDFDAIAAAVCLSLKPAYPQMEVSLVIPYYRPVVDAYTQEKYSRFDSVIVPPLEETPHRYRILKANQYIIDQADTVIAYVSNHSGGAAKTLRYALKCGKPIIDLTGGCF